jgi:hypothetical protein
MLRVLPSLGTAVLLGLTAAAQAAPAEPGCRLLLDPAGDARGPAGSGLLEGGPELDLRSGWVAVDRGTLVVTLRIGRTEAATTTTGEQWSLTMTGGEQAVELSATRGPDGVAFAAYGGPNRSSTGSASNYAYLGAIAGRLDLPAGRVTMSAPLTQLGLRPTSRFSLFRMDSGQGVATSGEPLAGPLSPTGESFNQSTTTGSDWAEREVRRSLAQRG